MNGKEGIIEEIRYKIAVRKNILEEIDSWNEQIVEWKEKIEKIGKEIEELQERMEEYK
jgi:uncharacterized coiled-coil DUF342 family protein